MSYSDFIVERLEQIAVVTLNRPAKGNSWTRETYLEMRDIQDELHYDENIRAIIFTGAGEKFFSAGADLSLISNLTPQWISLEVSRYQAVNTGWERHIKPVIMALNGITMGSGLELALAGDIRIAADTAQFSINEVKLGFSPDMGGTQRLTRVVGNSQAKRLILTGSPIDAQEALRIGLVDMVVPREQLMGEAMQLAESIAQNPPLAVRLAKKAINIAAQANLETGLLVEEIASTYCMGTEDKKEALESLVQKRKPVFQGR